MSAKSNIKSRLAFILPSKIIKEKHLRRKDVLRVKENITSNFLIVRLIASAILYLLSFSMLVYMGVVTDWHQVDVYGLGSITSQIVGMFGCLTTFVLTILVLVMKKHHKAVSIINRISSDVLFSAIAAQLILGLHADAQMGYTTSQEALSASIVLLTILVLLQPAYWLDAAILDVSFVVAFFSVALHAHYVYGMKAFHYYALISMFFPVCCYFVIALIFYAECQHYRDILENERLTDKAYYDSLTQCKNRHALSEFLRDNAKKWENRENVNLLIILFDIDNFKQYNDQFSHLGGDYCLKSIADAIRQAFPSPSLDFFRYGGEEFLLFFELEDPTQAPKYMEEVRNAIKGLDIEAPRGAPKDVVTISLGGLLLRNVESFSFEQEMALVDSYLYLAKASGKDVSCYNGDLIKE